jgi:murein DD-endopeptidase MepM/ murein hydrolase activator NlpD
VKPGDNPEKIAKKFGISVKELLKANNIKDPRKLLVGQKLKIPVKNKPKKKSKTKVKTKSKQKHYKASSSKRCKYVYKVKYGDSLSVIAEKFGVKIKDLKKWNNIKGNKIVVGQKLCIKPIQKTKKSSKTTRKSRAKYKYKKVITYYVVRRGDSLWTIAKKFNTTVSELKKLNKFKKHIKLYPGQRIKVPKVVRVKVKEKKVARKSTRKSRARVSSRERRLRIERETRRSSGLKFIYPVKGKVIKGFVNSETERHVGIDIKTNCGEPIKAVEDGKVIYAGDSIKTFGNLIIIRHKNRYNSVYGHVGKILVREGERVKKGQIIGKTGTLNQKGCGLYFEIRKNTIPINPLSVLEKE